MFLYYFILSLGILQAILVGIPNFVIFFLISKLAFFLKIMGVKHSYKVAVALEIIGIVLYSGIRFMHDGSVNPLILLVLIISSISVTISIMLDEYLYIYYEKDVEVD